MATHISEYLKPSKVDEEEDLADGTTSYGGHIPTIEDYDAGYSKRRKTYISDTNQGFKSEISQILMDKQSQPTFTEVEVQLEPSHHLSELDMVPGSPGIRPSELVSYKAYIYKIHIWEAFTILGV